MSEAKFTPGPWSACKNGKCQCGFIWDASGDIHVATAHDANALGQEWYGADRAVSPEIREANARLIAASPDLYAACVLAKDALLYVAAEPAVKNKTFTAEAEAKFFAANDAIRAALAKVRA